MGARHQKHLMKECSMQTPARLSWLTYLSTSNSCLVLAYHHSCMSYPTVHTHRITIHALASASGKADETSTSEHQNHACMHAEHAMPCARAAAIHPFFTYLRSRRRFCVCLLCSALQHSHATGEEEEECHHAIVSIAPPPYSREDQLHLSPHFHPWTLLSHALLTSMPYT